MPVKYYLLMVKFKLLNQAEFYLSFDQ